MANFLIDLNKQQYEAVTSPLGHTLVLAGAGSGKTRVLVSRIAWLIQEKQYLPSNILAVTFTNKAATEMKNRLNTMLSGSAAGLWIGTFHGLCHRLLRLHYEEARLPEHFHILDSEDQGRMIKKVMQTLNLDLEQWPVKQVQHAINNWKDEGHRSNHIQIVNQDRITKTLVSIYKAYEEACQVSGLVDFAELLLRTHELFRDNSELRAHYHQRFQAILVDEFQDTNSIQYAWISLLAGENSFVFVVGDDDQSIYGWRGAKTANIQQFSQDFKAWTVRLEQNYRSTSTILEAANQLITHNQSRMGKDLWTQGAQGEKIRVYAAFSELDEARFISERIVKEINQGTHLDEIAVLYRSNAQSRVIEEALMRAGISYRIYGGVRFFDRAEIKDSLAYLRLLVNPHDDSAFERIVNVPMRGIGDKTIEELRLEAQSTHSSLWGAATQMIQANKLSSRASSSLLKFIELIKGLQLKTKSLSLEEQIALVIEDSGLPLYFKTKEKYESRLDNLQELINAAKQFSDEFESKELPLMNAFLAHASLEAGDFQAAEEGGAVHLMTLHAAKGLEFPVVFLAGLEEGLFPSKQSVGEPARLEEERRLCYVGLTRAMRQLFLSYANIRRQYGKEEYHRPSRFLGELPSELLDELNVKRQAPVSDVDLVEEIGIAPGQQVIHPKFGQGTVLALAGSGAQARVQVRFKEEGIKWLVLAYAQLTFEEYL